MLGYRLVHTGTIDLLAHTVEHKSLTSVSTVRRVGSGSIRFPVSTRKEAKGRASVLKRTNTRTHIHQYHLPHTYARHGFLSAATTQCPALRVHTHRTSIKYQYQTSSQTVYDGVYRKDAGLRTLCGRLFKCFSGFYRTGVRRLRPLRRQRTLCGIRIKSFGTLFVSAPCAETPTCAILIETKVSSTNHIEACLLYTSPSPRD